MNAPVVSHAVTAPVLAGIIKKALEKGDIKLRKDCMCPVSYETISNLPGDDYHHLRESLIDQSNKVREAGRDSRDVAFKL